MQYVILKKNLLNDLIAKLSINEKVMAPVFKGNKNYTFEEVKDSKNISLIYIPTILPPKNFSCLSMKL